MADLSSSEVEVHEMNVEEKSSSHKKLLSTSIYHLYTPGQRRLLLLAAACISFLTPFTDTVYLPALTSVADTFDANDTLVALTVSIYLACVGLGQLFWGPLSDHYGRTIVLYVVLVIYEGLTIGCIFSDSIAALIILRSLQGLFVGCTIVSAQALIADIFPADELGEATGAFMAPMLFGPILAPIVGGILSQAFGWRSTFVLLAIMTGPIALFTLLVVPETHQWFVVQRIDRVNESRTSSMKAGGPDYQIVEKQEEEVGDEESSRRDEEEGKATAEQEDKANNEKTTVTESSKSKKIYQADKANEVYHLSKKENTLISIENKEQIIRPPFISPWEVFQFALDKDLAPFYAIQCLSFSVMFTCLTVAPLKLSDDPYNLSESIIGLTYLPIGVAMLLGSMVGGILSDKAAGMFPEIPEARLLYSLYPKVTVVIGGVIFGYSLEEEVNLSVVLISQFLIGFGQSVIMTMVLSFLTSARPKSSAGVAAVMMFLCFAAAAVFVSISVDVSNAIGEGGYFVILSGLFLLACIASLYYLSLKFTWFQLSLLSSPADDDDLKLEKDESKSDKVQSIELTIEKREEL